MWELTSVRNLDDETVAATFHEAGDPDLHLEMFAKLLGAETAIVQVSVQGGEDGCAVIPAARLRRIPFGQLAASIPGSTDLSGDSMSPSDDPVPVRTVAGVRGIFDFKALRQQWPSGDLDQVAWATGALYVAAMNDGVPPKQEVASAFGVSEATAGRMIAEARKRGHLLARSVGGRPTTEKADGSEETGTGGTGED